MKTEREKFEEWAVSEGFRDFTIAGVNDLFPAGSYKDIESRFLFFSWQARAAIDSRGDVSQGAAVAEAVPVDVASIREVISEMLEVSVGIFEDWADKLSRAIGDKE